MERTTERTTDFTLSNSGSLFVLSAVTDAAQSWVDEHVHDDALRWGDGIVVEHRFIDDIVKGLIDDGLHLGGLH